MIHVHSESERTAVAIEYLKRSIEELKQEIYDCDYEEDPSGNLVYSPNCYAYEKRMFESEKRKLEVTLELLTRKAPFSILYW